MLIQRYDSVTEDSPKQASSTVSCASPTPTPCSPTSLPWIHGPLCHDRPPTSSLIGKRDQAVPGPRRNERLQHFPKPGGAQKQGHGGVRRGDLSPFSKRCGRGRVERPPLPPRPWTAEPVDSRARWRAALRLGRGPCGARSCKYEATEGRAHLPVSPRTSSHAASPGVQAPREVMEGRGDPGALGVGGRFRLHSLGGHPQTGSVHPLLKTGPAELPR